MTSKGLSPRDHSLEMLESSIFAMKECNKGAIGRIIDESENVTSAGAQFHRHRPDKVGVNQYKWAGGSFA